MGSHLDGSQGLQSKRTAQRCEPRASGEPQKTSQAPDQGGSRPAAWAVTMPERGNSRPALTAMCERVLLRVLRRDSLAAMLAQFIARCMRHVIALPRKIPDYARKLGFFRGFYALLASDLGMGLVKV